MEQSFATQKQVQQQVADHVTLKDQLEPICEQQPLLREQLEALQKHTQEQLVA